MPSKKELQHLAERVKLAADVLTMRNVSHGGFDGDQKVMLALEVVREESPAYAALLIEHQCRKNAMEAVAKVQHAAILHPPTEKEMAEIKFHDNAHTVAWGRAEEAIEAMRLSRGGASSDV